MQTFMVQVRLGGQFEDLYVEAKTPAQAIAKARRLTTIKHRFAGFVV